MKFNKTTKYAISVVIALKKKDLLKSKSEIFKETKIPDRYLSSVLLKLKDAGLLKGTVGINGGYVLTKDWDQIRLIDILSITEASIGKKNINESTDELELDPHIKNYLNSIQNEMNGNLLITIQEIVNNY